MKCSFCMLKITILSCLMILTSLLLIEKSSAETCLTTDCHADLKQLTYSHSPVTEEDCSSCHEQVQAQHPLLD